MTSSTVRANARLLKSRMLPMPVAWISRRSCSTLAGVMTSRLSSDSLRAVR